MHPLELDACFQLSAVPWERKQAPTACVWQHCFLSVVPLASVPLYRFLAGTQGPREAPHPLEYKWSRWTSVCG